MLLSVTKSFLPVLFKLIFGLVSPQASGATIVFCSQSLTPICQRDLAFVWGNAPSFFREHVFTEQSVVLLQLRGAHHPHGGRSALGRAAPANSQTSLESKRLPVKSPGCYSIIPSFTLAKNVL